jgi:predicted metal-dependent peptidase
MNTRAAEDKLVRTRNQVINKSAFWASLIMQTPVKWDPSMWWAATNGHYILFNPEKVSAAPIPHIEFVLMHEVSHILGGDMWATKAYPGIDFKKWNISADYWINNGLDNEKFTTLKEALVNHQWDGLTKMEIYKQLKGGGGGGGNGKEPRQGDPNGGDVIEMPNDPKLAAEIGIRIKQAAAAAKAKGEHIPGWAQDTIEELPHPKVSWKELLVHKLISVLDKTNWSYKRTNRRMWPGDMVAPTLRGESYGTLVVAVDTSGSISVEELTQYFSEIADILENIRPHRLYILHVDTDIRHVSEYGPGQSLESKIEVYGRGGTSFRLPFSWVAENSIQPSALIYLTDMCGDFPEIVPAYPTYWIATTDAVGPFGETIRIDL